MLQETEMRFQGHQAVSRGVHAEIGYLLAKERIHFATVHVEERRCRSAHHAVATSSGMKMILVS